MSWFNILVYFTKTAIYSLWVYVWMAKPAKNLMNIYIYIYIYIYINHNI